MRGRYGYGQPNVSDALAKGVKDALAFLDPKPSVEAGRGHRLVPHEPGTIILECKDGPYEPLAPTDIKENPRGR